MEIKSIVVNETTLKIFSLLDKANFLNERQRFINEIIKDIAKKRNNDCEGFAGFINEEGLKFHLNMWNFGGSKNIEYPSGKIFLKQCLELLRKSIENISEILDKREIYLYIFPTTSNFIIEKMNGCSGRWIWSNVLYIDIFPVDGWEKYFESSIIHEVVHLLSDYYSDNITIGEGIVFEGLAEIFQEEITNIRNPYTKSISKEEAMKYFEELKPKLEERSFELYSEVFFGSGKYPLWTGYAIGYYLIKDFLKGKKNVDWYKLIREDPNKILQEILDKNQSNIYK